MLSRKAKRIQRQEQDPPVTPTEPAAAQAPGNWGQQGTRAWLADLASASCWTAIAGGLLVSQGGIWTHVNSGDLHAATLPWFEYVASTFLQDGRPPLWQPYMMCGTPVLAFNHPAALYPPVLVLFALLRPWAALQALYAFHILVLTWAMTTYLRHHGVGRFAAGMASVLAVTAVFRSVMLAGTDHPTVLGAAAWSPAMLLCWERALPKGEPAWVGGLGLATAAQWLAGYPDFSMDVPVLLGAMALVSGEATLHRRVGTLVAGLALGGALAAVQLLPLAEAVAESLRVDPDFPWKTFQSFFAIASPADLLDTLRFRFGTAGLVLALAGLWPLTRQRVAWLIALVWSTFALNLPFRLLYLLPPYSGVRFPFGWHTTSGVFLGILAALGLTTLWRSSWRAARLLGWPLCLAAAGHGLYAIWQAPVSLPPFRPQGPFWRAPDLALAASRAAELRQFVDGHVRVLSERETTSGSTIRHRIPAPNGHDPTLGPRRIIELLQQTKLFDPLGMYRGRDWHGLAKEPNIGALLGVGIVVVPSEKASSLVSAGFAPVGSVTPGDVVLRRPEIPRVRIVHHAAEAEGEDGTLAAVVAHAHEAERVAVVEARALQPPLHDPAPDADEEARIVLYEPERVEIVAAVAAPALLVLTDTFYPGWRATVDGVPVAILRADHAFRGIRLEPGRHRVVFRYAPDSVWYGALLTFLATLVLLATLTWTTWRRWRQGTTQSLDYLH